MQTKDQLRAEVDHWKEECERIKAEKVKVPGRVLSALKEISRKGDSTSANLAERALVDLT